jgi:hypothetical protein
MPEQGDPQVDTSYTGIIAQQAETIANLRTALENLLRRIDSHFGSIGHSIEKVLASRPTGVPDDMREDNEKPHTISLTGYQIEHLWDLVDKERDADISLAWGPAFDDEDGHTPEGLRAWFTEYPEEGVLHLYPTAEEYLAAIAKHATPEEG